jgi:hypothetical protein
LNGHNKPSLVGSVPVVSLIPVGTFSFLVSCRMPCRNSWAEGDRSSSSIVLDAVGSTRLMWSRTSPVLGPCFGPLPILLVPEYTVPSLSPAVDLQTW